MTVNKSKKAAMSAFLASRFAGKYMGDQSMRYRTWYRIGGRADYLVAPATRQELGELIRLCTKLEYPWIIVGEGANLLVDDEGFRGVVIDLKPSFAELHIHDNDILHMGAGCLLRDGLYYCESKGLGGLEGLAGIPGTLGGALTMNAGTAQFEIKESVREVEVMYRSGRIEVLPCSRIGFKYRSAPGLAGAIILSARLTLCKSERKTLREKRLEQLRRRAAKQPLEFPSCGSVFKRPKDCFVGTMVEELGLKGTSRGDAMISEKHGGFIVNVGSASADDVRKLIAIIQEGVKNKYGVTLEREVICVGSTHSVSSESNKETTV